MNEVPTRLGYLKLSNDDERAAIANILFKNGYTVRTVRRKRDGKSYDKYVEFELLTTDVIEEGAP